MMHLGDEVVLYSFVFVVVLLGTRNPLWPTAITASLYLFMFIFRFPQVPTGRARQVLHPSTTAAGSGKVSVVAHRGGGHDAPENTLAAIQEVRRGFTVRRPLHSTAFTLASTGFEDRLPSIFLFLRGIGSTRRSCSILT